MNYQIIPQETTVLVNITSETGVTEALSMLDPPAKGSMLVQQSKKDVLGEINLEKMLSNLDNCVDLLQITFNAVDGFAVQPKVQNLSTMFMEAMIESNTTALDFKLASGNALDMYLMAYAALFGGEVSQALEFLKGTKSIASGMVKKADALVIVYDKLTVYTNSVLTEVMKERADDETKRAETLAMIKELEGSLSAMNDLRDNLAKDIAQYDSDYKKMLDREIKQEERAHEMQMASLIIGAVKGLLGMAADVASDRADRNAAEQEVSKTQGSPSAETTAKRQYSENIAAQERNNAAISKADGQIAAIDAVLDGKLYVGGENHASASADDVYAQKTDEELRAEKLRLVEEKGRVSTELKTLKGKEDALGKTLSGLGVALDKVSQDTREAAIETQKAADSLADRVEDIRRRRDELKDQERKNLVQLAESTAKMQNMVIDENALESAIQCLVIAIGCLRKVLAYLQEIKLFWKNVEVFCDSLAANNNLSMLVQMQESKSPEQRAAYFKTVLFVRSYIGIMAKWQALYVIFAEYLDALHTVTVRLKETFEQSLSADRREQWRLATQLAGNLKDKLALELEA